MESFKRNGRVNQTLLDALMPADFALSDGRGGWTVWTVWTVEKHLRHMAGFRVGWLWNISREHTGPLLDHARKDADGDHCEALAGKPASRPEGRLSRW